MIKKLVLSVLISFTGGLSAYADEAIINQPTWGFNAILSKHMLHMKVEELGTMGPACDFVLTAFRFEAQEPALHLNIDPATFCPIDAIGVRSTQFSWLLPMEFRAGGSLRVYVNGAYQGLMGWGPTAGVSSIQVKGE